MHVGHHGDQNHTTKLASSATPSIAGSTLDCSGAAVSDGSRSMTRLSTKLMPMMARKNANSLSALDCDSGSGGAGMP